MNTSDSVPMERCTVCGRYGHNADNHQEPTQRRCTLCGELGHRKESHIVPLTKVCNICKRELPIEEFRDRRQDNTRARFSSECIDCDRERSSLYYRRSFSNRFSNLVSAMRRHAEKRGVPCEIDKDYLLNLLDKQDHKCYYSGITLNLKIGDFSVSIDRLEPGKGYIDGNVVLCCWLFNNMKRNLTEEQFYNTMKDILEHRGRL